LLVLKEIIIILGLSSLIVFLCNKTRIPGIVGFLATGILAGPYGLGLIGEVHEVEVLAEIGVVLLLFTIGMEFSLDRLIRFKRSALLGGSAQMIVTALVFFSVSLGFGLAKGPAVFMGFLAALSSTAIVLKILQERTETETPHGGIALSILIFQDIAVIPLMLYIPFLAGAAANPAVDFFLLLAKGALVIVLVAVSARGLVPAVMKAFASTRDSELFILFVVFMCFSVAWATSRAGMSLALGAFLAGLIISESEYSHQALAKVLPFKHVFTSFFFVSVGMLLDTGYFIAGLATVIPATAAVMACKAAVVWIVSRYVLGYPQRTSILAAIALAQVGEFSFILAVSGMQYGLLSEPFYQLFLSTAVLSMLVTPFAISAARPLARRFEKTGTRAKQPGPDAEHPPQDHLVIIGFGTTGRYLAAAAKILNIPYTILEMNPQTVRRERTNGEPIHFGDATGDTILQMVGVHKAKALAIAISDAVCARRVVKIARDLNPRAYIAVRTRFLAERDELLRLGANDVIPEEYEAALELLARVLHHLGAARGKIETLISGIKEEGYVMLKPLSLYRDRLAGLDLPDVAIRNLRVEPGSPAAGKTLGELELRKKHGIAVLAIGRDVQTVSNPGAADRLAPGDTLLAVGDPDRLDRVKSLFSQTA